MSILTVLVVTFFLGGVALAERCPDLTGKWDVSSEASVYDQPPAGGDCLPFPDGISAGCFTYRPLGGGVLEIKGQDGCLFYGAFLDNGTSTYEALTGVFKDPFTIKVTGITTVAEGTLAGPRRINAIVSVLGVSSTTTVNTARSTLIKR